jgi:epoxyqueuosine reductase
MGNRPAESNVGPLAKGLNDEEPLIRAACAWALGRHRSPQANEALRRRQEREDEPHVRAEVRAALDES